MRDLLAALVAALGVWLAARAWLARGLSDRGGAFRALGHAAESASQQQRPFLTGPAARFAGTGLGARLKAYAALAHPTLAFSDVFAIFMASVLAGGIAGVVFVPIGPLPLLLALAGPLLADRLFIHINGRRTAKIEKQLPGTLAMQAAALRAGNSVATSLRLVAAETKPPLSEEIARTAGEIDLGRPQQDALKQLAVRTGSGDVDLWVTAMLVNRVTGGNLAAVVEALAQRVRERLNLRAELKALTAQGRMSGVVVAAAPLVFLFLMSLTSRHQMQVLYQTRTGWLMLALGLSMEAAGFLWIRWILRIRP
ncbi:MAG: type II secretion system F family protein [Actinomycetota bacterium]